MDSLLDVSSVSKSFTVNGRSIPVLGGISFSVGQRDIVAILGASGCGKTTLLRIVQGIEMPDGGMVESAVTRPGPGLGYQSQNDRLLPWRTVLGNVALGLELTGSRHDTAHARAKEVLHQVGLADFCNNYPGDLSGGMTQRALLARTLSLSPKLLLLDEPMSNLDIIARQELGALIKSYIKNSQKAGAIIVTHSVEEACQISDRVMIISQKPSRIVNQIDLTEANRDGRVADVHRALIDSLQAAA